LEAVMGEGGKGGGSVSDEITICGLCGIIEPCGKEHTMNTRTLVSQCCGARDRYAVNNAHASLSFSDVGVCPRCEDACSWDLQERRDANDPDAYDYNGPWRRHDDALRDHLAANASLIEKAKENAREAAGGAVVGLVLTIILAAALLFDGPTW
jgi:hypothetical protein